MAAAAERVAELAEAVRDDEEDEGPEPQAGDADKAEREIVRLERRVAALGPVNALAPEQHERLAEPRRRAPRRPRRPRQRLHRHPRHGGRLTGAIDSRFEAVFGAVSVHFHELFAELFPEAGPPCAARRRAPRLLTGRGRNSSGARRAWRSSPSRRASGCSRSACSAAGSGR